MQPHPVWWPSICIHSEVKIPHDCVNSLYNLTELSGWLLGAALPEILVITVLHYLTCIRADAHYCFDSLYYCIVWFDVFAIVLFKCIGTSAHSLYNLPCILIALYYWNVLLGLHAHLTVWFAMYCIAGYNHPSIASLYYLKIMSNVWEERFKGTSTHPKLWVRNTQTCVLCIVLLGYGTPITLYYYWIDVPLH